MLAAAYCDGEDHVIELMGKAIGHSLKGCSYDGALETKIVRDHVGIHLELALWSDRHNRRYHLPGILLAMVLPRAYNSG